MAIAIVAVSWPSWPYQWCVLWASEWGGQWLDMVAGPSVHAT